MGRERNRACPTKLAERSREQVTGDFGFGISNFGLRIAHSESRIWDLKPESVGAWRPATWDRGRATGAGGALRLAPKA